MEMIMATIILIAFGLFLLIAFNMGYTPKENKYTKTDLDNSYQNGKTEGLRLGYENGRIKGYEEMQKRASEFLRECLNMVNNDEMELVEVVPVEQ
jgi:flagellar biosynthesis/type III secretory pathway protein FliH